MPFPMVLHVRNDTTISDGDFAEPLISESRCGNPII